MFADQIAIHSRMSQRHLSSLVAKRLEAGATVVVHGRGARAHRLIKGLGIEPDFVWGSGSEYTATYGAKPSNDPLLLFEPVSIVTRDDR
jgi:hypothetical protein